jgi:hypothetical protein
VTELAGLAFAAGDGLELSATLGEGEALLQGVGLAAPSGVETPPQPAKTAARDRTTTGKRPDRIESLFMVLVSIDVAKGKNG